MRAILDEHDQHIARRSIEIASAQTSPCPEPGKGEAAYVGDATCATCHPAAMEFWKGTRHAGAWHTLVDLNKHFSTQCVSCHVTGFQRPGGACDVVATQGRQNVQCEACHGAGSVHATSASPMHITSSPGQGTCTTCHDPTNSPHFNFPAYLAKILGPGHGAPADVSDRKTDDVTGVAYD